MQYESTTRNPRTQDLTNHPPFGRWTVLHFAGYDIKNHFAIWMCQCHCGTLRPVFASMLINGTSQSCGCLKKERLAVRMTTHGKYKTPERSIWNSMIQRCHNPNDKAYKNYGGRGITVCDRWRDSFEAFYTDMGPRPAPRLTLERLENDGPYCKENCAWKTYAVQRRNTRANRILIYKGVSKCATDWAILLHMNRDTFFKRLRDEWTIDEIIETPVDPR